MENIVDYYDSVTLINNAEIINVVRRSLSKIDPRLVDHGERVGYIALKLCEQSPDRADFDLSKLYVLCVLHDIGAYKTDEIDEMVKFETEAPFDHSLYGYLFLKNTTHLADYAGAVLYHHTDFCELGAKSSSRANYAQIIHLADRADILLGTGSSLAPLSAMAGTSFNPLYVEALFKAEERTGFCERIISGEYKEEIADIEARLDIENSEIMDYLRLLVYAIDFRSPYTVTHTADTTIIRLETGRLLGLSERELQLLYIGAFLHDIGKIAISNDILEKPGKLTPEEFAAVKEHIPEGEEILRGVLSDEICDIALRHHEKLDGSGYSRGLTSRELTFPQRIVAVADILSALSQRRSYKEPFAKEKVIGILREMRDDGLLCRRVVDIVCEYYDVIMRKTEISHDPVKELYSNLLSEYAALRVELDKEALEQIIAMA